MQSIAISMSVCMSVCPLVFLKTNLMNFFVQFTYGCDSVLL